MDLELLEHVGPHMRVIEDDVREEDFNIIVYPPPTICHGQALLDHIGEQPTC